MGFSNNDIKEECENEEYHHLQSDNANLSNGTNISSIGMGPTPSHSLISGSSNNAHNGYNGDNVLMENEEEKENMNHHKDWK